MHVPGCDGLLQRGEHSFRSRRTRSHENRRKGETDTHFIAGIFEGADARRRGGSALVGVRARLCRLALLHLITVRR